jgi:light-regulated signal transduction histidine kinase (bacteriophytochrome)
MSAIKTRIIIVDDERPLMLALCETLRYEGYVTAGFTMADEALQALREQEFDLLLTDLLMPEMDGLALLRAAQGIDPDIVVVMLTGNGTVDGAVEAMKSGAADYVLKPFNLDEIRPVLARALALRKLKVEKKELERCVRERTAALEDANKELEAFAHSVSHDLSAPIRAIRGYAGMLKESANNLSARETQLIEQIAGGANELAQIVDGMLRLARAGRQALVKAPVDVGELVHDVLNRLKQQSPERRIETKIGNLPSCTADPGLLRQVFANLLSNAFKFTANKDPTVIEVDSSRQGSEIVYWVRDNGAGFDMRYAEKLFSPFERLHTPAQFEGTGIGLSIAQRIVQRHGGRVWAEGSVGGGATFFLTLAEGRSGASCDR